MKIRQSFVTNSSSSSFLLAYEVNADPEFIKEEFGKFGQKIIDNYAITDITTLMDGIYYEFEDILCDNCNDYSEDCDKTCDKNKDKEWIKKKLKEEYFEWKDDCFYLIGYKNQGYGGKCDISDDSTVQLGSLLKDMGLAKVVYQGGWT